MSVTPRHLSIGILSLLCVATLTVILLDIARGMVTTLTYIDAFALLIFVGLLWAAWRGWAYVGYVIVGFVVLLAAGALDSERLRQVQQQALTHIEQTAARHLILDVTGVTLVDTQVAKGLIQVVQAAQLLGAEIILVGIRPEVAQTIVGLGLPLDGVTIRSTLQAGIAYTLGFVGR